MLGVRKMKVQTERRKLRKAVDGEKQMGSNYPDPSVFTWGVSCTHTSLLIVPMPWLSHTHTFVFFFPQRKRVKIYIEHGLSPSLYTQHMYVSANTYTHNHQTLNKDEGFCLCFHSLSELCKVVSCNFNDIHDCAHTNTHICLQLSCHTQMHLWRHTVQGWGHM